MRNKALHIAFSFLLIISTIGVTVAKHYCGNLLVSVSLYNNHKSCCGEGCKACHTEHNTFKVTDNFETSSISLNHVLQSNIFILPQVNNVLLLNANTGSDVNILLKAPPLIVQSNSLLQVFRC